MSATLQVGILGAGNCDFPQLRTKSSFCLRDVRSVEDLEGIQLLLIGHVTNVSAFLQFLRRSQLDAGIAQYVGKGLHVMAMGHGAAVLAEAIVDLDCVQGNEPGLGLLPLVALRSREETCAISTINLPEWPKHCFISEILPCFQWAQPTLQSYRLFARTDLQAAISVRISEDGFWAMSEVRNVLVTSLFAHG